MVFFHSVRYILASRLLHPPLSFLSVALSLSRGALFLFHLLNFLPRCILTHGVYPTASSAIKANRNNNTEGERAGVVLVVEGEASDPDENLRRRGKGRGKESRKKDERRRASRFV